MLQKIYLSPPHLSQKELQYVQEAFETNWVAPVGKNIDNFEAEICGFTKAKYAVALNSGTSALHLALRLLSIKKDDTVICPSFTFVASANPILYQSAKPIFVDSEKDTWNICPKHLAKAIKACIVKKQKPKAIIVVHLYGQPAKMDDILALANDFEIPIIEDAAEALGSSYRGQKLGTFGKMGVFSFNGNKIMTTSAGGMLITNNEKLAKDTLFLATQAKDDAVHYQHSQVGFNYRLSNVLAGIGLGQMEVLEERLKAKRTIFDFYRKHLGSEKIELLEEAPKTFSNRWLTCVLFTNYQIREKVRLALAEDNIESRPLWKPLHLQPLFERYDYFGEKVAESLFERGLCLPSGTALQQRDLRRIIAVIQKNI